MCEPSVPPQVNSVLLHTTRCVQDGIFPLFAPPALSLPSALWLCCWPRWLTACRQAKQRPAVFDADGNLDVYNHDVIGEFLTTGPLNANICFFSPQ